MIPITHFDVILVWQHVKIVVIDCDFDTHSHYISPYHQNPAWQSQRESSSMINIIMIE